MFEERYLPNQPAVKSMAQRIADNSPQVFATTDDFVAAYGQEAANMISRGGLLTALLEIGIQAAPCGFQADGLSSHVGLKTSPVGAAS